MSKGSITLSPKHGLNPSVTHCECCGKEIGVALFGRLRGDKEAPRDVAMGYCDDCQKVIDQQGLMIIEVYNGASGSNPERTGRIVGITKNAKERMFKNITSPVCYMEQPMFSQLFNDVV